MKKYIAFNQNNEIVIQDNDLSLVRNKIKDLVSTTGGKFYIFVFQTKIQARIEFEESTEL